MAYSCDDWRIVIDWPSYEVNCEGRVRRAIDARRNNYKRGRLLRVSLDQDGYLQVTLNENGEKKAQHIHKLVCVAFHGHAPSPQHQVRHLNGNKLNVHPDNLCWGTSAEQHEDQARHGTGTAGERNPRALVTQEKVDGIRADYAKELTGRLRVRRGWYPETQQKHGITRGLLAGIVMGRNWRSGVEKRPLANREMRWQKREEQRVLRA